MTPIEITSATRMNASRERHARVATTCAKSAIAPATANVPANPVIASGIAGPHGCSCGTNPKKCGCSVAIVDAQSARMPVGCGAPDSAANRCDFLTASANGIRNGAAKNAPATTLPPLARTNRQALDAPLDERDPAGVQHRQQSGVRRGLRMTAGKNHAPYQ